MRGRGVFSYRVRLPKRAEADFSRVWVSLPYALRPDDVRDVCLLDHDGLVQERFQGCVESAESYVLRLMYFGGRNAYPRAIAVYEGAVRAVEVADVVVTAPP